MKENDDESMQRRLGSPAPLSLNVSLGRKGVNLAWPSPSSLSISLHRHRYSSVAWLDQDCFSCEGRGGGEASL